MPYQLRRIVAVNIRNTTGLPSQTISELDPRGSVLAVGANGVGKTTFLRLLPLFYGATPSQILRGSGRSSMIAYTLPDASSAVAFEYERESASDLRCVVMFCEAGKDAPVFYILGNSAQPCGFREDLFYDSEQNFFVARTEFSARTRQMGVAISEKLPLHLYRSVILNERLFTKEGASVRDLAPQHGLSLLPLSHLDQIAAAMANEKISFRDLQNIVIDRVSGAGDADGRSKTQAREMRKSRRDVVKWIEDRDHLARVMKQGPQATALLEKAALIKEQHARICGLHSAIKASSVRVAREQQSLLGEIERKEADFQKLKLEREDQVKVLGGALNEAAGRKRDLEGCVLSIERRLKHFESIDVLSMVKQAQSEPVYKERRSVAETDLGRLTKAAGGAQKRADQQKAEVATAESLSLGRIADREREYGLEATIILESLSEEESRTLEALAPPARIGQAKKQRDANLSRAGEIKGLVANPSASAATLERLANAKEASDKAGTQMQRAVQAKSESELLNLKASSRVNAALATIDRAFVSLTAAKAEVDRLQDEMEPAAGSLLEHLRSQEPALWAGAARVIDRQLLGRTDLKPRDSGVLSETENVVSVGSVLIDVSQVAAPDWVTMEHLKDLLAAASKRMDAARADHVQALENAKAASIEQGSADKALAEATADCTVMDVAAQGAAKVLSDCRLDVEQERTTILAKATAEQLALVHENQALDEEIAALEESFAKAGAAIRSSFEDQRRRAAHERKLAADRFEGDRKTARAERAAAMVRIDDEVDRELKGLGIDTERIHQLNKELSEMNAALTSIAQNRHEVEQWLAFSRDELPLLGVRKTQASTAHEEWVRADAALSKAGAERTAFEEEALRVSRALADRADALQRDAGVLERLLKSDVSSYLGKGSDIDVVWAVDDLELQVGECRTRLVELTEALGRQSRQLRDILLERDTPVSHWIDHREKALLVSNVMLDHESKLARAQVLCDWFHPGEEARNSYIAQMHQEMDGFLAVAGNFAQDLGRFDKRVAAFNSELQAALSTVTGFQRFGDLSVRVLSSVGSISSMSTLRQMQDAVESKVPSYGGFSVRRREIPTEEDAALIRKFRDIIPDDGVLRVNLSEQVKLECSLVEGHVRRVISSEEEFKAVSSTGNTALITAMFLMGFVEMIRKGDSAVRLTWVTDEVARFDADNLRGFLKTLGAHRIDVISATPSADPALARFFSRICVFEDSGEIFTTESSATAEAPSPGGEHVIH